MVAIVDEGVNTWSACDPSVKEVVVSRAREVLCLMPAEGHPRHWRRVSQLQGGGFAVTTACFSRPSTRPEQDDPDLTLGRVSDRAYARRFLTLIRVAFSQRARFRRVDVIYAFGLDMFFLGYISSLGSGIPIVLEIGDIRREQYAQGFAGVLVRAAERWFLRRTALLVVTSESFLDGYYLPSAGPSVPGRRLVLHNIPVEEPPLTSDSLGTARDGGHDGELTIGLFGMLRCDRTLAALAALLEYQPQFRLKLAGLPSFADRRLFDELCAHPRVRYVGPYRSPEELPQLYADVDLVWTAYPLDFTDPGNWLWARTNRFFESVHYGVPPICRAGTPDARHALDTGIGPVIEVTEDSIERDVVRQLSSLSYEHVVGWRSALVSVQGEVRRHASANESELIATLESLTG